MSLRARLIVSFTVLLLAAILVVGVAGARFIRTILIDQVDTQLIEVGRRLQQDLLEAEDGSPPFTPRSVAVMIVSQGQIVGAVPSGFGDQPDPLPDVSSIDSDDRGMVFLPIIDGGFQYRALVRPLAGGRSAVLATPLRNVADATRALVRSLLLTGLVVSVIGAAAAAAAVRQGLRPVDRMVETAEAIARGDLSRRVPDTDQETELGRLAASLNEMLGHIERAVATERGAKDRLRRFVADASHELRTPLAALSGYAELHQRGGLEDPAELDKAMGRIHNESRRMGKLVEDLLLLARLDQTQPLESRPFDLAATVGGLVTDHRAMDPDRSIIFDTSGEIVITGDEGRLSQVVSNLLANARGHTPEGTSIEVGIETTNDEVVLTVADDGPGLPPDALEHVFERFYRADASRSRALGGSGLGLAIVAAIVAAHGGTTRAENLPASGARITVTLPRNS